MQDAQEVRKEENIMTEEARQARNAYKRKWYRENPDKVKAQQERYWNKKALQDESERDQEEES